ncbi:MAG: DciA family protein [Methylophilaceae bacterium]
MRKINALLKANNNPDNQFSKLVAGADKHLDLQQFWQAAAPQAIAISSHAGYLKNQILTVYAHNNSVAAKIKLTSASLLTQLQNLQKTDSFYKPYKLTGIMVKVQVKSQKMPKNSAPRTISRRAATTLVKFADNLGDSTLADKLRKLANNV